MLDAVTDGRHATEVRDGVGLVLCKEVLKQLRVAEIAFDERELPIVAQVGEVPLLVLDRLVIVHVVDAADFIAAIEQCSTQTAPHKPGGPGHENLHSHS
jgi:hypothetical protein